MAFPACESVSRPPHSSGVTPQRPDALRAFSYSRLAAAVSNVPGGQGRFASSARTRFPFVGTAVRPLLRARPRLTSPGARERPLPERNTHSFPSAGDEARRFSLCISNPPYTNLHTEQARSKALRSPKSRKCFPAFSRTHVHRLTGK